VLKHTKRPPAHSFRTRALEQPLEIEHLGRRTQSDPQQRLRRQQRNVVTGGAIDLQEVTRPKILGSYLNKPAAKDAWLTPAEVLC
jgi:hypothetical protein